MAPRARVAVVDPLPLFRLGVMASLAASGHEVAAPADVAAWLGPTSDQVILVSLARPYDWDLLRTLSGSVPRPTIVTLLDPVTEESALTAISLGAASVIARGIASDDLATAIDMTLAGNSVIPTLVLKGMSSRSRHAAGATVGQVTPRQLEWLAILAAGATVAELARQMDYSERTMFRLLSRLYKQMDVDNRTEALIQAHEHGWLSTGGG